MTEDIQSWEIFASLFRTGSVALSATEVGLDAPVVSKKISALEKKLGRKLFDRSTRPFVPTDDAAQIIEFALGIAQNRSKIRQFISDKQNETGAVIRVMQGNSARKYAISLLSQYGEMHPKLRFELIAPMDIHDFVERKADIIAISGEVPLSDCVFLSRGRMIFVPVASPAYLQKHGPINHPRELESHLVFNNGFLNRFTPLLSYPFKRGDQLWSVTVKDKIRCSNVEFSLTGAIEGLGICPSLPLFLCIDELEKGKLVPILDGWHRPSRTNYIVCRKEDWKVKYIREFATWYAEQLKSVQTNCEERFVRCFGRSFLNRLAEP